MIFNTIIPKTIDLAIKLIDEIYVNEEEKLEKKIILERLRQKIALSQIDLNKIEASSKSLFISGWRPAIGWICTVGLFYEFLICPILYSCGIETMIGIDNSALHSLVASLLGIGAFRTYEKCKNVTK